MFFAQYLAQRFTKGTVHLLPAGRGNVDSFCSENSIPAPSQIDEMMRGSKHGFRLLDIFILVHDFMFAV